MKKIFKKYLTSARYMFRIIISVGSQYYLLYKTLISALSFMFAMLFTKTAKFSLTIFQAKKIIMDLNLKNLISGIIYKCIS